MKMRVFGTFLIMLFVLYGIIYPIFYFSWNYLVIAFGYPNAVSPGFFTGMLAFYLIMLVKSILFRRG